MAPAVLVMLAPTLSLSLSPLRVKGMTLLVEVGRKVGKKGEYHKKLESSQVEEVLERS
jgi:hypothetical protein